MKINLNSTKDNRKINTKGARLNRNNLYFCGDKKFHFMKKIQMVDLPGQYKHIKETVDASIFEVLNSAAYINGPYVKEFQADLEKLSNYKVWLESALTSQSEKLSLKW